MKDLSHKIKRNYITYKTPLVYASSSILKAFSTLLAGFFVAKFVTPEDLGLWTTLSLFITYSLFLQGGVINGLNLELPLTFGQGKNKKARLYASVGQTFTLYSSLFLLAIGVGIYFLYPFTNLKIKYGILGISIIIVATFYQNYLLSTFRSNNAFLKLSYLQVIDAVVNIATVVLVIYFAFYGLLLKAAIVIVVFVGLLHFYRPIKVNLRWDKKAFFTLLETGLPIFLLSYLEAFALTFDKILLIKYSDLENLGFYSFALYALVFSTLFSNALASYIYPKMTFKYGQDKNKLILWKYVWQITIVLLAVQLPMFVVGYYIIPYAISTYFPVYAESILAMQILLFAGIMKGAVVGVNVLWSMKKWKFMIIYQGGYAILLVGFIYFFINFFSNKIVGVAVGMLGANFINFFIGIYLSYLATHEK